MTFGMCCVLRILMGHLNPTLQVKACFVTCCVLQLLIGQHMTWTGAAPMAHLYLDPIVNLLTLSPYMVRLTVLN